ncbi:efflux RND transporter permease subunit [Chitinophaga ginsengisoli]|uniref:Multidrug efflux pump subunit AcrB n=1 Tax=Chitinophaga ginsengisoli TaxID=363837 RepID=A0A2P8FRT3_9BACT|nr:efflux RND transporter permease subunit [Chitinophaga ginsengisoli]PSL24442.1 multidrug efflux pump subunit AcrB [Chitinophaga ginsengisoli]
MREKRFTTSFSSFSTILVFVLCMLIGAATIPLQRIQLSPSHNYGSVSVECYLPGASAEVMDLEVSTPIESTLAGLKGLSSLRSTSGNGMCYIQIDLDKWTDPEIFRFEASVLMRRLYERLPKGASYPIVTLNKPDNNRQRSSILNFAIRGPGSVNVVADMVEEHIRPLLADLPGVDRVEVYGRQPEQYAIQTNSAVLGRYGLSFSTVQYALNVGLSTAFLGVFRNGEDERTVFVDRSLAEPAQLSQFPVAQKEGSIVHLGDIAHIERRLAPQHSYYRINGKEQVSIAVFPAEHINTLDLSARVRQCMDRISKTLPRGFEVSLSTDNTEYIREELNKVYIRTALSLVILLTFVLLITRQLRYLLIVVSSLLANILLSFILYYFLKIEIHLYSLAGITLSLGLVVDNAIVIVEDLRHTGRNRIFAAILASTMTAIGALSVIFFLGEQQRILLLDFALCIIVNLLVSLPIAYFFIPAMLDKFPVTVKASSKQQGRKSLLSRLPGFYNRQLQFMLRFRFSFVFLFILAFGIPVYLLPKEIKKESFWAGVYNRTIGSDFYRQQLRDPLNRYLGGSLYLFTTTSGKRDQEEGEQAHPHLNLTISMPKGATLQQMDLVVRHFEALLGQYSAKLKQVEAQVNSATNASIQISFLPKYEKGFPYQLKDILENKAIEEGAADFQIYGVGRGFSNAVDFDQFDADISIAGYNYQQLKVLANKIQDTLLQNPRMSNVVISTRDRYAFEPVPEYYVQLNDPQHLSLYKIARADIGRSLQGLAEASEHVGQISAASNKTIDVAFENNPDAPPPIWSILHAPSQVNDSVMLRMDDMGTVKSVKTSEDIVRVNQAYILHIHYRFTGSYELNKLIRERLMDHYEKILPFGYSFPGRAKGGLWFSNDTDHHLWLIPLVLLIIYIICAVLLESLLQPLAVILIIPFSFTGVFLVFYLLDLGMDQGAYASLLMVSALVTNTALYIINDLNFIRNGKQYKGNKAVHLYVRALQAKAMPILVTTASAVLSLLPFMLNGEEQGFWFTLSAGTIGGLLFSVLGAFLFLPLCLIPKDKQHTKRYYKERRMQL